MAIGSLGVSRRGAPAPTTVLVPGGRYLMGSDSGRPDEQPVHSVAVAPFRMGRTPVTNLEYARFLAVGRTPEPTWWADPAFWAPDQPVVGVTWFDAMAYAGWLGETAGGTWRPPPGAAFPRRSVTRTTASASCRRPRDPQRGILNCTVTVSRTATGTPFNRVGL